MCGTPCGAGAEGGLAMQAREAITARIDWLRFARDLRADINNQSAGADRMISQECFERWAMEEASAQGFDPHLIFYDEERASEFDRDERPLPENEYKAFLSKTQMEAILVHMQILSP